MNKAMQAALVLAVLIASIVAVSVVSDTTDAEAVWYDDFEEKPEVPTNPTSGYVCKVGDQNYSDFSAAYEAAIETGKELVLLDDFTIEKMEVPADTLPVLGATALVAVIPVPASPSAGAKGMPAFNR